jgi:SSS family solute:Na+ symporter
VYDIYMTAPMAPAYLQTVHPVLMNHGVIAGMGLSAVAFFGVSLLTKPSSAVNLAPFFKEEAKNLAAEAAVTVEEDDPKFQKFLKRIDEQLVGERAHLHVRLESSASINWQRFVEGLRSSYVAWVTPTGVDSVYRLVQADMLSCISITRGTTDKEIWFASEPPEEEMGDQKKELYVAYKEVAAALESMGVFLTVVEE